MRTIVLSFVILVVLAVLFVASVASGISGLVLIPFCGWTPAVAFFGFAIGRAGLKVNITTADTPETRVKPVRRRESRIADVG